MRKMTLAMMVQLENSMNGMNVRVERASQGELVNAEEAAKSQVSTRGKDADRVEVKEENGRSCPCGIEQSGGIGV